MVKRYWTGDSIDKFVPYINYVPPPSGACDSHPSNVWWNDIVCPEDLMAEDFIESLMRKITLAGRLLD